MDLLTRSALALMPLAPRFLVRSAGARYVAGETLDDAMALVDGLSKQGMLATVDVLGEEARDAGRAEQAVDEYTTLVDRLCTEAPRTTISIKPTLMGLGISSDLALENIGRVSRHAVASNIGVQMDMEGHDTTDATLDLYGRMQALHGGSGVALQARLHRTLADIDGLAAGGAIRICKGIYEEPPDIAYTDPERIRDAYSEALHALLERGHYVGIATHDDVIVERALEMIRQRGLDRSRYEFQMLLGVRPALGRRLVGDGHVVRVYVPFGKDWHAYSMRRLRESPHVLGHVLKSLLSGD